MIAHRGFEPLTEDGPVRFRLFSPLLAAALIVTACGQRPSGPQATTPTAAPTISVAVAPASKTTIVQTLTATGSVQALSEISVIPKQAGRIEKMPVDVGTRVKAGDVIAQLEHTTLDLSLQNAQAQLLTAQARLDTIKAGPRAENVREAELAVSSAQAKLQDLLAGPKPANVAQAAASLDSARQKLAAMQAGGQPNTVKQAQASLASAQARLQSLKDGPRPADVTPLEVAVEQAKSSLNAAQISRDGACGPSSQSVPCKAGNATVEAAQNAVNQAEAGLRAKVAPPSPTDLQQAQAAVDQAQAALNAAQNPYTAQDVQQAQDAVRQAQAGLALAQQPYTAADIEQARNAVTTAQQQLALTKQPYTEQDVQTAQAGVAQAQVSVDQVRQSLADTTVTAPVDGVITQKLLSEGALASTAAALVTIASSAVKVELPVDETQVTNLKLGQAASISGAVLGANAVPGKVTNVAPSGDAKARTFNVDVTPDQPEALRPGMFVKVTIEVLAHQDVTAVPTVALVDRLSKNYVFVVQNGVAHEVPVEVGLTNAQLTEITSGVDVGTAVVVQGLQSLNDGDRVTTQNAPAG
jgi:HlyD family secretion protein